MFLFMYECSLKDLRCVRYIKHSILISIKVLRLFRLALRQIGERVDIILISLHVPERDAQDIWC